MNTGIARYDERSLKKLSGIHPKLKKLVNDFARVSVSRFIVTEGLRTVDRQRELVDAGASRTMESKHLVGRAVDLAIVVGSEVRWDWPLYRGLADEFKAFAAKQGVKIVAGADWKSFPDGPHFQLGDGE